MRYKVSFTDYKKPDMLVSEESGIALMKERASEDPVQFITIHGGQYELKSIKDIEPSQEAAPVSRRLSADNTMCRGQYSIHWQIRKLFKDQTKIRDYAEFYSKAYPALYDRRKEWCDYKLKTCYCETDYVIKGKPQMLRDVENIFGEGAEMVA